MTWSKIDPYVAQQYTDWVQCCIIDVASNNYPDKTWNLIHSAKIVDISREFILICDFIKF